MKKKEYILIDNCDNITILKGTLARCLDYVKNYELSYCLDKNENSKYCDKFDELLLNDESIICLLDECEFTIKDSVTNKIIQISNIKEMITN